ncbi:tetratricopeptide repeat-containing diguanylate cyclase [Massilia consociata]|uniref:diguanylate cyclase n=1 Tax=Massilia consociata TaxID=760117 RepID=A0ABV6FJ13_9BURK
MFSSRRVVSALLLAASLLGTNAHGALSSADARAELRAIHELAERSTGAALRKLEILQASMGETVPYALHRDMLRTEVWLREDAGQREQSYAVERKIRALALAHKDSATAARARLGEVRQLLDQHQADKAQAVLENIVAEVPVDAPPTVVASVDSVLGDVHNARARFDKALEAYLRALRQLEGMADAGDHRATLYGRIAHLYINTDHPEKAVETARQGVAETGAAATSIAALQLTEGIALIRLGRDGEGIIAFQQALVLAERAGLGGIEASIRGNIADYFLRQRDYMRAEDEARKALEVSTRVKDENLIIMAKANLGFALMGQGKMAQGEPYVDAVIVQLREAGAVADLEAMLDEKGRMQEAAGLHRNALATVREQQALQQRSARSARDRAIAALQEEFDASQRTRQIALLQRENVLKDAELASRRRAQWATGFAIVLTVLACAIVYVLYRRAARSNAQLQQLNRQLEYHSMRDPLTGLHNRRAFLEKMRTRSASKEDRRAGAASGTDCFVLMDIDHFKSINDRWGHAVGDAVLVEVARRLAAAVRDTDIVLRWGGEEFLVYAPATDPDHLAVLARRILDAVGSAPVDAQTCRVPVTLTAGVASLCAADIGEWEGAIRLADWALYQGKAQGRNQARIVSGMRAPVETVLAALDGAAGAASAEGLVEIVCVHGPSPDAPA